MGEEGRKDREADWGREKRRRARRPGEALLLFLQPRHKRRGEKNEGSLSTKEKGDTKRRKSV